jgi:hypothetical protein
VSLIGEALKRARLEAARREGEERGTAHSSLPAYLPARRRSRATWVAATVLAALAGAAVVYLMLRPVSSSTPAPSAHPPLLGEDKFAGARDSSNGVEPQMPAPSTVASETPVPIAAAGSPPSSRAQPRDLGAGLRRDAAAPPPLPSIDARDEAVASAPPLKKAADAAPAGAKVYVRVAELGGARLELDGIVASDTDPVAMINRKLLGIGEGLDGWVVEKIEAKQVTLRGGRETVVLRLR